MILRGHTLTLLLALCPSSATHLLVSHHALRDERGEDVAESLDPLADAKWQSVEVAGFARVHQALVARVRLHEAIEGGEEVRTGEAGDAEKSRLTAKIHE